MAAAVDMPTPGTSPREQEEDVEGNLFSPANDVEVDASPLTSKVIVYDFFNWNIHVQVYMYMH